MAQDDERQKIMARMREVYQSVISSTIKQMEIDAEGDGDLDTLIGNSQEQRTPKIIYFGSDTKNRVVTREYIGPSLTGPSLIELMFNENGSYNPDHKKNFVITIR